MGPGQGSTEERERAFALALFFQGSDEEKPSIHLFIQLKLQYFGHLMQITDSLEKTLML